MLAGVSREAKAAQALLTFTSNHFLQQKVCQPTRGHNMLDLIFTDIPDFVSHVNIQVTELLSDHNLVTAYLGISLPAPSKRAMPPSSSYSTSIPAFNTLKGEAEDWEKYREELNTLSWEEATSNISPSSPTSLNQRVQLLASIMEGAVSAVFQRKTGKTPGNKIPLNTRKLMRARKAASDKVYLAESMEEVRAAREELAYLESVIQTSYEHMRDKLEEAAVTKMVPDPKFFYEFAKRNAKVRSQI